jgi:hypothetical protein
VESCSRDASYRSSAEDRPEEVNISNKVYNTTINISKNIEIFRIKKENK